MMIAGDGYAYVPYYSFNNCVESYLNVLRIDSSGNYATIQVTNWTGRVDSGLFVNMITNADQGILLTWENDPARTIQAWGPNYSNCVVNGPVTFGMATTAGASATLVSAPQVPGQVTNVAPVVQAQDGSFVGSAGTAVGSIMVAFDAAGNVRWTVPNDTPQIATDDGGVIGQSGIAYDQYGNATGQVGSPAAYSWFGNSYQVGSIDQVSAALLNAAPSFWAFAQGNASRNGTANKPAAYAVQQLVAQTALSYVGSQNWTESSGDLKCNIFVQQVLTSAGAQAPVSSSWRSWTKYELGLASTAYYPALAGDWANPSTDMKCWHNVPPLTNTLGPDYPAEHSRPGDVIAEAISYSDASGHVGIVVGSQQTASADSAAWCFPPYSPAGTIDISSFGFRPDNWLDPYTNPATGQPCRTSGLMSNAVVKRFVCQ